VEAHPPHGSGLALRVVLGLEHIAATAALRHPRIDLLAQALHNHHVPLSKALRHIHHHDVHF
jgi:hypothetical protein